MRPGWTPKLHNKWLTPDRRQHPNREGRSAHTSRRLPELVVDDDIEDRGVHLDAAVVLDQSQLPELVQEVIDAGPGPTRSAGTSWLILGTMGLSSPSLLKFASSRSSRASRFSLELKS